MRCEDVRNELAGRLIDDLDERVRGPLREHLDCCAGCREEAAQFEQTWIALDGVGGGRVDSAAMRERFDAALAIYKEALSAATPRRRDEVQWDGVNAWMAAWWPRQPLLQAAVAMLLLAAGLVAGHGIGPARAEPDPALGELQRELRETRQMVMLSLLHQPSAVERLRGVSWSHQIDQPGAEVMTALVDALAQDSNVNVRLACVEALRQFSERPHVREAAIRGLSEQTSPLVRIALIDFIVDTNQREAVEALRRLSEDPAQEVDVRERASRGLHQLSQRSTT